MISLPQPDDLTSLILRVDFGDDGAWGEVIQATEAGGATCVSDVTYSKVTVRALIDADMAAADDDKLTYLFLADAITMVDKERPLLAVDLYTEPGRTFRVPPRWYADVSANLSIANMGFDEFADAADESGTYRGFDEVQQPHDDQRH
ncbi:DUF6924 domain-containing protein [Micromonospora sp. NPDC004704]